MAEQRKISKWQQELESFKGIKSTFIIEGNINDIYPNFYGLKNSDSPDAVEFTPLDDVLYSIIDSSETEDFYNILYCDPLSGFSENQVLEGDYVGMMVKDFEKQIAEGKVELKKINGKDKQEAHSNSKMVQTSETIRAMVTTINRQEDAEKRHSVALIINFASHLSSVPDMLSIDEKTMFLNLLHASMNAIKPNKYINTLILVVEKFNDIPAWFYLNNPNIRTINIANPDRSIRELYTNRYFKDFSDCLDAEILEIKEKFIDTTDGMKIKEIDELRRLYTKLNMSVYEALDVVSIYKYGFKENEWQLMRDKIDTNLYDILERRVKGQPRAIEKIVSVIKRSVAGLSGMQHSSNTKPRGILFLAGPTGTGKTEMAKAAAELLFGDEKSLLRFDMSEYSAEHSDQKLFGAPPGYVGYGSGGQLTNAVKSNPFSVLLFDEIEKADPSVMDKFLQILEDGRMTDGQGNTVYFSETLIFFTSNVGISKEILDPLTGKIVGRENILTVGEPYDEIKDKVEKTMAVHFKPEVLNRIGDNIVVFDYISEEASKAIVRSQVERINNNILKQNKINVVMSAKAYELLMTLAWQPKVRENGGRGIGNVIEVYYLNPLSEFMFDEKIRESDSILVNIDGDHLSFEKGNVS